MDQQVFAVTIKAGRAFGRTAAVGAKAWKHLGPACVRACVRACVQGVGGMEQGQHGAGTRPGHQTLAQGQLRADMWRSTGGRHHRLETGKRLS